MSRKLSSICAIAGLLSFSGLALSQDYYARTAISLPITAPTHYWYAATAPECNPTCTAYPSGAGYVNVYDIDNGFNLVKTITLPTTVKAVRGLFADPTRTHLYIPNYGVTTVSTNTTSARLLSWNLSTNAPDYDQNYTSLAAIDRACLSADGLTIYAPSGENVQTGTFASSWYIITAATGVQTGVINLTSGAVRPHNTICAPNTIFMVAIDLHGGASAHHSVTMYPTSGGAQSTVCCFTAGDGRVRPFALDRTNGLVYVNLEDWIGFAVGKASTGAVLFDSQAPPGYTQPGTTNTVNSHGIAITPNGSNLYVADPNMGAGSSTTNGVERWNVSGVRSGIAPSYQGFIPTTAEPNIQSGQTPGWIDATNDGKYVVTETGEVIATPDCQCASPNTVVYHLSDPKQTDGQGAFMRTRYMTEIDTPGVDPNAIIVATNGNDSNPCTVASPCLTLTHAQTVAQSAADKTIYLRAGTYNITAYLHIATADNGETWTYYPPDGVDSPIINGTGGLNAIFLIDGSNLTFDGLTTRGVTCDHYIHDDGTTTITNLTIRNGDMGFNTDKTCGSGYTPLIRINGGNGIYITHNYVHDSQGQGISLYAYQTGLQLDNVVVDSNVVTRTSLGDNDTGAIYTVMPAGSGFSNYVACCIRISNNYVADYGAAGVYSHGIYLDGGSNHVTVTGNIIGPPNPAGVGTTFGSWTSAILFDGNNLSATGNIVDLGNTGNAVTLQAYHGSNVTMGPFTYSGNIDIMSGATQTQPFAVQDGSGTSSQYTVANNVYYNYSGGPTPTSFIAGTSVAVSDASPQFVNPQLSGWPPALASGSPAYATPVNFPSIVGNWGPPGFVIPQTGTPPTNPH